MNLLARLARHVVNDSLFIQPSDLGIDYWYCRHCDLVARVKKDSKPDAYDHTPGCPVIEAHQVLADG